MQICPKTPEKIRSIKSVEFQRKSIVLPHFLLVLTSFQRCSTQTLVKINNMDRWAGELIDGWKSRFKNCRPQSKIGYCKIKIQSCYGKQEHYLMLPSGPHKLRETYISSSQFLHQNYGKSWMVWAESTTFLLKETDWPRFQPKKFDFFQNQNCCMKSSYIWASGSQPFWCCWGTIVTQSKF